MEHKNSQFSARYRHWERFLSYAGRVRSLNYFSYGVASLNPYVFQRLSTRNSGRPLLPALRWVRWDQGTASDIGILILLVPTMLQYLALSYACAKPGPDGLIPFPSFDAVLVELSTKAPDITELSLTVDDMFLPQSILPFTKLTTFRLTSCFQKWFLLIVDVASSVSHTPGAPNADFGVSDRMERAFISHLPHVTTSGF